MEAIIIGLVFIGLIVIRFKTAMLYAEFYDALPESQQKELMRRAMLKYY